MLSGSGCRDRGAFAGVSSVEVVSGQSPSLVAAACDLTSSEAGQDASCEDLPSDKDRASTLL